jgi:hypothetical protein
MALFRLLYPLLSQSDISQPLFILALALGMAGLAILILFAKDKI